MNEVKITIKSCKDCPHFVYQTFDSYKEALIFCLEEADSVLERLSPLKCLE